MTQWRKWAPVLILAGVLLAVSHSAFAYVPVRVSIKWIVDSSGERPAFGNLNTDDEIENELEWADTILQDNFSEFRIDDIELVDLTGVSQWYNSDSNGTNRDDLRSAAQSDPSTYLWRTNAINIYITAGTGSAVSKFPPDNDIILMNQNCGNTPSCIMHELGHSLNLYHTHESCCTNQDECADTITDNKHWSKDEIAQVNFGDTYANLTSYQQSQVDMVFNNVMSYHTSEPQVLFSKCQLGRVSTQADSDRNWLLQRIPVYVDRFYTGGTENGRFPTPYKTVQTAVSNGLSGTALVLNAATYEEPFFPFVEHTYLVPRLGSVTIGNGAHLWTLPTDLNQSETPEVSNAAKAVRLEDKSVRQLKKQAKEALKKKNTSMESSKLSPEKKALVNKHRQNAIDHLKSAVSYARGREKIAILFEIGQRHRDSGDCESAAEYFNQVASETEQVHLKKRALLEIKMCPMYKEYDEEE